jgi:hypothetical protein
MPSPYPFTAGPFANNSSQSSKYPNHDQSSPYSPSSPSKSSSKRPYPSSSVKSPSTTSLLPSSATTGTPGVQAAFAKGPPSLRSTASNTSLVRPPLIFARVDPNNLFECEERTLWHHCNAFRPKFNIGQGRSTLPSCKSGSSLLLEPCRER